MDGLVTENDIHAVVEIPEVVLGCRQLTAVILWVIPENIAKMDSDSRLFQTYSVTSMLYKINMLLQETKGITTM